MVDYDKIEKKENYTSRFILNSGKILFLICLVTGIVLYIYKTSFIVWSLGIIYCGLVQMIIFTALSEIISQLNRLNNK